MKNHLDELSEAFELMQTENYLLAFGKLNEVKNYLEKIDSKNYSEYPECLLMIAKCSSLMGHELSNVIAHLKNVVDHYLAFYEDDLLKVGSFQTFYQSIEYYIHACSDTKDSQTFIPMLPKFEQAIEKQIAEYDFQLVYLLKYYMFVCQCLMLCEDVENAKKYQELARQVVMAHSEVFESEEVQKDQLALVDSLVPADK